MEDEPQTAARVYPCTIKVRGGREVPDGKKNRGKGGEKKKREFHGRRRVREHWVEL